MKNTLKLWRIGKLWPDAIAIMNESAVHNYT